MSLENPQQQGNENVEELLNKAESGDWNAKAKVNEMFSEGVEIPENLKGHPVIQQKAKEDLLRALKYNYAGGQMPLSSFDLDGKATANRYIKEYGIPDEFFDSEEYQHAVKERIFREMKEDGRLAFPTGLKASEGTLKDPTIQELAKKQALSLLDVNSGLDKSKIGLAQETIQEYLIDESFTQSPEYMNALLAAEQYVQNQEKSN
jgi:hypothetical protein